MSEIQAGKDFCRNTVSGRNDPFLSDLPKSIRPILRAATPANVMSFQPHRRPKQFKVSPRPKQLVTLPSHPCCYWLSTVMFNSKTPTWPHPDRHTADFCDPLLLSLNRLITFSKQAHNTYPTPFSTEGSPSSRSHMHGLCHIVYK
jgi:hypothetical protein